MSSHPENTRLANELRFARRVVRTLERGTLEISPARLEQLAAARKSALRAQKVGHRALVWARQPVAAGAGSVNVGQPFGTTFARGAFALGLVVLVASGIATIFSVEQERRINELADIDAALLSDEIPLSAYADHGFNAYVKQNP